MVSKMSCSSGILFLLLIALASCSPLGANPRANESKSTIESTGLFSAPETTTADEHQRRIKRQFGFPFMQGGGMPFMQGGGMPFMQGGGMPFYMPLTFPTIFTISSQKQKFQRNFFGERGGSKNFFLSFGR